MRRDAQEFLEWVRMQTIMGAPAVSASPDCVYFPFRTHVATVSISPFTDEFDLCELRVLRIGALDPSFRCRFAIKDRWRCRELFREMAGAVENESKASNTRVYVVSRDADQASKMAERLREVSQAHSVAYTFEPLGVDAAMAGGICNSVIMLLPDVATLRDHIYHHNRASVICALPRYLGPDCAERVFELLLESLCEVDFLQEHLRQMVPVRPLAHEGAVLVLHVMYLDRCVRIGYRVYDGGIPRISESITKARLDMVDIDDLIETLAVSGYPPAKLAAICITLPGIVNFCSMNLPSLGDRDQEIRDRISCRWHIPVIIENSTNAAAYGLYMLDDEHDSITLYRHQFGHRWGGQGTVAYGNIVKGLYNLAGEPKFYERHFSYDEGYTASTWSEHGLTRICTNVLLVAYASFSPEVAYLSVTALEDADEVTDNLRRYLPPFCEPDVRKTDDYRDCMYLGGAALALRHLKEHEEEVDSWADALS